jgi:hypothetical protein
VSVIDRWLKPYLQDEEAATLATSATSPDITIDISGMDIADGLLQTATFWGSLGKVADCSNPVATENNPQNQAVGGNVADVADVARGEDSKVNVSEATKNPPSALTVRFLDIPADESTGSTATTHTQGADRGTECDDVPANWLDLYEERSAIRQYDGHYSRTEAQALAWSEVQTRWHMEHGERVSCDSCAGCRRSIGTEKTLDLIDGSRVHLDDGNSCLLRHGERWRAAATRALMALGLRPPAEINQEERRDG